MAWHLPVWECPSPLSPNCIHRLRAERGRSCTWALGSARPGLPSALRGRSPPRWGTWPSAELWGSCLPFVQAYAAPSARELLLDSLPEGREGRRGKQTASWQPSQVCSCPGEAAPACFPPWWPLSGSCAGSSGSSPATWFLWPCFCFGICLWVVGSGPGAAVRRC